MDGEERKNDEEKKNLCVGYTTYLFAVYGRSIRMFITLRYGPAVEIKQRVENYNRLHSDLYHFACFRIPMIQ